MFFLEAGGKAPLGGREHSTRGRLRRVVYILQLLTKPFVSGEQRSLAAQFLPEQAGGQRPVARGRPAEPQLCPPGVQGARVTRSNSPNLVFPSLSNDYANNILCGCYRD